MNPLNSLIGNAIRSIKDALRPLNNDQRKAVIQRELTRLNIPVVIENVEGSPNDNEGQYRVNWRDAEGGETLHQWFSLDDDKTRRA